MSERTGFCQCAFHLPPVRVPPSDLWIAAHRAHHLAWQGPVTLHEWRALAEARAVVMVEQEHLTSRLRARLHDLEDELSIQRDHSMALEAEVYDLSGELADARERHPSSRDRDG